MGLVLGDVGEPQLVGRFGLEVALHEVLASGGVLQVLHTLARSWQTPDAQLAHDSLHELGVDDETLFDL